MTEKAVGRNIRLEARQIKYNRHMITAGEEEHGETEDR